MRFLVPALLLALSGCSPDGFASGAGLPVWDDELSDDAAWSCTGAPGGPRVELIEDDEAHVPLADGALLEIARRPQGETTVFAPLWVGGLDGGDLVYRFEITFADDSGDTIGLRRSNALRLPCEDDGEVAAHHFEVFFGTPAQPVADFDGLSGELSVRFETDDGLLVQDSVHVVLVAAAE